MITQSTDTNPEAERFLISLLRKASKQEKLKQTFSFSSTIIKLSRRAISRANPDLNKQEKDWLFVKYHYGEELADRFRAFLNHSKKNEY